MILTLSLACSKHPAPAEPVGPPGPEQLAATFLAAMSAGDLAAAAAMVDPEMWLLSKAPQLGFAAYVASESGDEAPDMEAVLREDPEKIRQIAVSSFPLDVERSLGQAGCRIEGPLQAFSRYLPRPARDEVADVHQVALVPAVCAAPEVVVGSREFGTFDEVQGVTLVQRGEPPTWRVVTLQTQRDPSFPFLRELVTRELEREEQAKKQFAVQTALQAATPPRFEREPGQDPAPPRPARTPAAPGDLDGDGRADLVLFVSNGHRAHVWTAADAAPAHTFEAPDGGMFTGHIVLDLDGDGHNELVLAWTDSDVPDELWVVSGRALGSPPRRVAVADTLTVTSHRRIVSPGDLSGDGLPDLVFPAARDTLEVWGGKALRRVGVVRGNRESGLGFSADSWRWPDGAVSLALGEPSLAYKQGMVWLLDLKELAAGVAATAARLPGTLPEGELGASLAMGDFDGDGSPELAASAPRDGGSIVIAALTPTGIVPGLTLPPEAGERLLGSELTAADLDGDGADELISSGSTSDDDFVRIYRGGPAGLAVDRQVTLQEVHGHAVPGDLDGDGMVNMVTTHDTHQRTGGTALIWTLPAGQEPLSRPLPLP